ncbi:MAG: AAA family ATPase, partial [Polyangiales bacterium]
MAILPPSAPDALVGRAADLDVVLAHLAPETEGARIVVVTGPVGVGKSRLARAAVAELEQRRSFSRFVVVDASGVTSRDELSDAIAGALGVRPDLAGGVATALEALDDALVAIDALDGLDDVDAAFGAWLDAAPTCRFLVTRRARASQRGSSGIPIEPLPTPTGADLAGPAAELLLQCIRRARATYVPTSAEAPVLAELLRELDGLPLAIELAAPRLEVM